jgi:hypothetical protein
MIPDPEPVAAALRFALGVKDVDIVQFPSGKELWVVLKDPVNIDRLRGISESLGYMVARQSLLISKLPRSLAEMVWDGVTYVIIRHTHIPGNQEYSARVMKDLATGDVIYHVVDADGLEILKEYLNT